MPVNATLTFLEARTPLVVAPALADLEEEDSDFLSRHVVKLREEGVAQSSLFSKFQEGSGVPPLIEELQDCSSKRFVDISASLAQRLQASMDQVARSSPGILAVVVTGEKSTSDAVSLLKLDAVTEAAAYAMRKGRIKLSVFKDLLPAPGNLQKGISLPDSREFSDALVVDRNIEAARYFFNAFELRISPSPSSTEKALGDAIVRSVPALERGKAAELIAKYEGPVASLLPQLQKEFPRISADRPELGAAGALPGYVRGGKVAAKKTRFRGEGIEVLVPNDQFHRVDLDRVGGGWEMKIQFSTRPAEEST